MQTTGEESSRLEEGQAVQRLWRFVLRNSEKTFDWRATWGGSWNEVKSQRQQMPDFVGTWGRGKEFGFYSEGDNRNPVKGLKRDISCASCYFFFFFNGKRILVSDVGLVLPQALSWLFYWNLPHYFPVSKPDERFVGIIHQAAFDAFFAPLVLRHPGFLLFHWFLLSARSFSSFLGMGINSLF